MAWNPSPEVAAVRDAAQKLNSPFAVLVYLSPSGEQICTASYGKTMALCREAGKFSEHLLSCSHTWEAKQ